MKIRGMTKSMKILVVEDNTTIIDGLKYVLQKEGYETKIVTSKAEALKTINNENFDLFLLDVQLPDGTGFEICKYIKQIKNLPIIFTSAIGEEVNVVYGLDLGADDFIIKPFRNNELLARIKCVLRRYKEIQNSYNIIFYRNLKIDTQKAKVTNENNKEIYLSCLEYKLFLLFLENINKIVSRKELLEKIWDIDGNYVDDNTVTVYIKRLREKIESNNDKQTIQTIRGIGYVLNE